MRLLTGIYQCFISQWSMGCHKGIASSMGCMETPLRIQAPYLGPRTKMLPSFSNMPLCPTTLLYFHLSSLLSITKIDFLFILLLLNYRDSIFTFQFLMKCLVHNILDALLYVNSIYNVNFAVSNAHTFCKCHCFFIPYLSQIFVNDSHKRYFILLLHINILYPSLNSTLSSQIVYPITDKEYVNIRSIFYNRIEYHLKCLVIEISKGRVKSIEAQLIISREARILIASMIPSHGLEIEISGKPYTLDPVTPVAQRGFRQCYQFDDKILQGLYKSERNLHGSNLWDQRYSFCLRPSHIIDMYAIIKDHLRIKDCQHLCKPFVTVLQWEQECIVCVLDWGTSLW